MHNDPIRIIKVSAPEQNGYYAILKRTRPQGVNSSLLVKNQLRHQQQGWGLRPWEH